LSVSDPENPKVISGFSEVPVYYLDPM
jgi:hypothetical protein